MIKVKEIMQLTKFDVVFIDDTPCFKVEKVQQVRKFYEDYRNNVEKFRIDFPKEYEEFLQWKKFTYGDDNYLGDDFVPWVRVMRFNTWLFNYCFVEELK